MTLLQFSTGEASGTQDSDFESFSTANLTSIGSPIEVYLVITKELATADQGTGSE